MLTEKEFAKKGKNRFKLFAECKIYWKSRDRCKWIQNVIIYAAICITSRTNEKLMATYSPFNFQGSRLEMSRDKGGCRVDVCAVYEFFYGIV